LRLAIEEIAVSAGSACNAESLESSHVLTAMGLSDALAESSLRLSIGRDTTTADIDYAVERIVAAVEHLRAFSRSAPAWCTS
jgi:cysteine desulfurase